MSDDPETARQIDELAADTRPLLVLDVDDVVLEFLRPFPKYLNSRGFDLKLESFGLHGNILDRETGTPLDNETVSGAIDDFFAAQQDWQTVAEGAAEAMAGLSEPVEIVLLTAMPHRHRETRRVLLERFGLTYPLLTTERAKGPAIRLLRGENARPVAFVDDMPSNLVSVRRAVADAHLFHLTADNAIRKLMPPTPDGVTSVENWREAAPLIAKALGVKHDQPSARKAASN